MLALKSKVPLRISAARTAQKRENPGMLLALAIIAKTHSRVHAWTKSVARRAR
jgi:hypothetical protein